jgi:hypothetical protein
MNPKMNSSCFQNYNSLNKKQIETNIILDASQLDNKDLQSNQDHNMNSLFKVVQEEKEPHSPNNFLFMNNEKNSSKSQSKNINIIKPKFVTKTMHSENIKLKNMEESSSLNLNLSLNLNSSAFQPQIIIKDKEFKVKINNKIFNLILDIKNDLLKLKLYEINENIYLLKFFYENNFSLNDLKQLHRFFYLFDNLSDMLKELEKILMKNKYNVFEDSENKKAKIQIKVILLEKEESIEFPLIQKAYTKDNLFEILCKKVSAISNDYGQKIIKLEGENQFLLMNFYRIINTIGPMNMNYQINQRDNSMHKVNNTFNNNININKDLSLIKKSSNNENKYSDNKENNNNYEYEEYNEVSNDNSNTDNFDDEKEISDYKHLNKKRNRRRSLNSNASNNKNCTVSMNVIKNNGLQNSFNDFNKDNYYYLKDIKTKTIKCKGLFEIIRSNEELYLIINKILYKFSKYKKMYNVSNYENKFQFSLINLFDSSINGDKAYDFHAKCDFKYNTISLIETTNGHRFGGFTSECFESPNDYFDKKDNLSFVFSLDKMRIYDVIKGKYAISCDKNYGPYFRDDHICIVDEFFTKESGTCIKGKGFNTTKNYELNSGKKYFIIKRLQVFQINIKNNK